MTGVQTCALPIWASLSITNSQSVLKLMSIKPVMPSNHLILCLPLLLLSSIFPSIWVFSNEVGLCTSPRNPLSSPLSDQVLVPVSPSQGSLPSQACEHCNQPLAPNSPLSAPFSFFTARQRTDASELWCWRRLLRVPWTARRSNQSILKEINPEYSLEGLMLKLKLQYFGHLMRRANPLEQTLRLGKIESRRRG